MPCLSGEAGKGEMNTSGVFDLTGGQFVAFWVNITHSFVLGYF